MSKTRYCGWHKRPHLVGKFKAGQRYCTVGMKEYQRQRRGASEEAARSSKGWHQGSVAAKPLTGPQRSELVRRHNLSVEVPLGKIAAPHGGQKTVCQRLRQLRLIDQNNELTVRGTQKALELGGNVPENAEKWLDEQVARLQKVEKRRRDKVSSLIKSLAESDLEDADFYDLTDAVAEKLKPGGVL